MNGSLQDIAKKAKRRMKSGYWNDIGSNNINFSSSYFEDELYHKVCMIMESEVIITNPIEMLVDNAVYASLDDSGKEKYVLQIANTYTKLKKRYMDACKKNVCNY